MFDQFVLLFWLCSEYRCRMREAMNATTNNFLSEFTPKLVKLFHSDLCAAYLDQMNDHLQTFYNDVLSELETKQNKMLGRIDGKLFLANSNNSLHNATEYRKLYKQLPEELSFRSGRNEFFHHHNFESF